MLVPLFVAMFNVLKTLKNFGKGVLVGFGANALLALFLSVILLFSNLSYLLPGFFSMFASIFLFYSIAFYGASLIFFGLVFVILKDFSGRMSSYTFGANTKQALLIIAGVVIVLPYYSYLTLLLSLAVYEGLFFG